MKTPYEAYLQDTLETLTLDEIENLMEFEPNEVECEVWGITPDECTRELVAATRHRATVTRQDTEEGTEICVLVEKRQG